MDHCFEMPEVVLHLQSLLHKQFCIFIVMFFIILQILLLSEIILLIFHIVCAVLDIKEISWFGDPVCQSTNYTTLTFGISPNSSLAYNMVCVGYPEGFAAFLFCWNIGYMVYIFRLVLVHWYRLLIHKVWGSMRKHDANICVKVALFCGLILLGLVYVAGYMWEVFVATQMDAGYDQLGIGALMIVWGCVIVTVGKLRQRWLNPKA